MSEFQNFGGILRANTSKVKTERLVSLYRKLKSVRAVTAKTTLSYMGVRFRLIKAGVIDGKLW